MNSINQNQAEENHENLSAAAAIKKIRDMTKGAACFFCTRALGGGSGGTRPMSVLQADEAGDLWFLSASDSHTNRELKSDPGVELYFQRSPHSDFMHLVGTAQVSTDQTKIDELWEPLFKTWFTEGKEDPRITVIRVSPTKGYYWDTKHGNAVAGIKMLIGAALGKTLDDSIEGTVAV
jgi:general stress protein 26